MAITNESPDLAQSDAPFMTASGRRMPVRELSADDIGALIEFSEYLARRAPNPEIVGLSRADIERLTDATPGTMVAIMAGPRGLIRGVSLYKRTAPHTADVRFTVDDSVLADGVFPELVRRIAESARENGITQLRAEAALTADERAALMWAGYPISTGSDADQRLLLDLSANPTTHKTQRDDGGRAGV